MPSITCLISPCFAPYRTQNQSNIWLRFWLSRLQISTPACANLGSFCNFNFSAPPLIPCGKAQGYRTGALARLSRVRRSRVRETQPCRAQVANATSLCLGRNANRLLFPMSKINHLFIKRLYITTKIYCQIKISSPRMHATFDRMKPQGNSTPPQSPAAPLARWKPSPTRSPACSPNPPTPPNLPPPSSPPAPSAKRGGNNHPGNKDPTRRTATNRASRRPRMRCHASCTPRRPHEPDCC